MAWNESNGGAKSAAPAKRGVKARGAVAGGIAVALVAVVALFLTRGGEEEPVTLQRTEKVPAVSETATEEKEDVSAEASESNKGEQTAAQNGDAVEERQLTPEEAEAEARRKDPLYRRHHIVAKMPLVKEPVEQLMLSVFTTELGDMPPMLPAIPAFEEERFEKLVNQKTVIEDGDSEEAVMSKEIVNAVKEELAKFLKEGGTTSGFLAYYVNELDAAFKERESCRQIMMSSMRSDSPEVARGVFEKFNERLVSKGIKPLTLTRRQREYLGITEE